LKYGARRTCWCCWQAATFSTSSTGSRTSPSWCRPAPSPRGS
jgi:hypothetical protein